MLSIHTECILDKIDEYRRNWLLHLQRMPPNRIPLKSSLQTTRKNNNWKTEETLARAVVTLETERTRGPNPDVYEDDDAFNSHTALYNK